MLKNFSEWDSETEMFESLLSTKNEHISSWEKTSLGENVTEISFTSAFMVVQVTFPLFE